MKKCEIAVGGPSFLLWVSLPVKAAPAWKKKDDQE
jgi:hypothetical protein